jgi:excisionase family DNA binding protein
MSLAENTTTQGRDSDTSGFLTVKEFAGRLRVGPATIYAAISAGEIEGVIRIGRRRALRIPVESYAIYTAGRLVTGHADVASAA